MSNIYPDDLYGSCEQRLAWTFAFHRIQSTMPKPTPAATFQFLLSKAGSELAHRLMAALPNPSDFADLLDLIEGFDPLEFRKEYEHIREGMS